jgi:dihydrodipicolinate synthase/N-acetylneuraminate lyase
MSSSRLAGLGGVVTPLITPLRDGGAVDEQALGRLASRLLDAEVGGLFVLGSSGEGPWLTPAERAGVIRVAVEVAAGRVPVLVGLLEPSAARVVEAAEQAAELGADAVVVTTPYYFEADDAAQRDHFGAVATRSALPLIVYNIPKMTHNVVAPSTVRWLLEFGNVVGIKDSAGDAEAFAAFLALKHVRPDFRVLQGAERQAARALREGADGLVPGLSNVAPALFVQLAAHVSEGAYAAAERLQEDVAALWELHTHGFWLECLKFAVAVLGIGNGAAYGRTARLDEGAKRAIRQLVEGAQP